MPLTLEILAVTDQGKRQAALAIEDHCELSFERALDLVELMLAAIKSAEHVEAVADEGFHAMVHDINNLGC